MLGQGEKAEKPNIHSKPCLWKEDGAEDKVTLRILPWLTLGCPCLLLQALPLAYLSVSASRR